MKHASRMVRPNRRRSTNLVRLMKLAAFVTVLLAVCPSADAQQSPPTLQRLLKKAQAVVAEVERRVDAGQLPQDVIDELQQLDGLMQAGKHEEAEALLDDPLVALGIDPKTPAKKPAKGLPAQAGAFADHRPLGEFNPAGFTRICWRN